MSTTLMTTCDRCGLVLVGVVGEDIPPTWDVSFHPSDKKLPNGNYSFVSIAWDLCDPCGTALLKVARDWAGKPSLDTTV